MAYKNIHDNFWRDEDVKALDDKGKILLLYAMTCQHSHLSGIYHLPLPYIEHDLEWPLISIEKTLDNLQCAKLTSEKQNFFLKYDKKLSVIWVRNMFRYQVFMKNVSRHIVSGVKNHLISLPLSPLLHEFSRYYSEFKFPFCDHLPITSNVHGKACTYQSVSVSVSEESGNLAQLTDGDRLRIERLLEKLTGNGFNPHAFLSKALSAQVPLKVCEEVLKKLVKYKDTISNPWGYALDILRKDYAKHNYAKNLEDHYRVKNMDAKDIFAKLKAPEGNAE